MDVFYYMPLALWKDMAERFLDPTSFGRLRQVNKALKYTLGEESKEKMVKRCTIIEETPDFIIKIFMNTEYSIFPNGDQWWSRNGMSHRAGDLPAIIKADGEKMWCQYGKFHRDNDQPAHIKKDGTEKWYRNGKLHRDDDKPAIVWRDGRADWWQNGEIYRRDNLPTTVNGINQKQIILSPN